MKSVVFHPLEVTSPESAQALATWLKREYGGADILINNAALFIKGSPKQSYDTAKSTLDVNYYGVKTVTNALLPILRPGARIVNISSLLGQLRLLGSSSWAAKLGDVEHLTEESVDSYVINYLEDLRAGVLKEEEWSTYSGAAELSDSKILLNAHTRAFAKTLSSKTDSQRVYVNLVHPGIIRTDMNTSAPGTLEEGADTAVWLALLPAEAYPNGQFFFERERYAW